MPHRYRRTQLGGSLLLLVFLSAALLTVALRGQTDDQRRLAVLEDIHAERRLSVIETRLDTIEFVGKSIFAAVFGQLVLQIVNMRQRKQS